MGEHSDLALACDRQECLYSYLRQAGMPALVAYRDILACPPGYLKQGNRHKPFNRYSFCNR